MPAPELQTQTPGDPLATMSPLTGDGSKPDDGATTPRFVIEHRGSGRWIVIDATAELVDGKTVKVGDFMGAKDEAQAEADRLNAGGEPFFKPDDGATDLVPEAKAITTDVDPTKIKAPVMTSEGWLCPEVAPKE